MIEPQGLVLFCWNYPKNALASTTPLWTPRKSQVRRYTRELVAARPSKQEGQRHYQENCTIIIAPMTNWKRWYSSLRLLMETSQMSAGPAPLRHRLFARHKPGISSDNLNEVTRAVAQAACRRPVSIHPATAARRGCSGSSPRRPRRTARNKSGNGGNRRPRAGLSPWPSSNAHNPNIDRPVEVSRHGHAILQAVAEADGLSQTDIMAATGIDRSSTADLVVGWFRTDGSSAGAPSAMRASMPSGSHLKVVEFGLKRRLLRARPRNLFSPLLHQPTERSFSRR